MSFVTEHKKIADGWHLTTKELKELGYPAHSAFETRRLMGCDTPSYEMQYDDLNGKPIGVSRFRLFDPTKVPPGSDSKPRKYTCKHRSPVSLFLPRGLRRVWTRYAKDRKRTLYITEGEAKALYAALRFNLPCIAVQGNSGWQKAGVPAAQFDWFDWQGRRVIIIPDSDFRRNAEIRQWFAKLGKYLEGRGAKVKFRLLPDLPENFNYDTPTKYKTGLDDWFFHTGNGIEEFRKLPTYPISHEYIQSWDGTPASVVEALEFPPVPLSVFTKPPKAREYVCDPFIGKKQLMLFVAAGGMGKGFVMLDLAVCVATGQKWFGFEVTQGRVVLLSLEDDPEEVYRRLHDVVAAHVQRLRLSGAALKAFQAQLSDNVRCESLEGKDLQVIEMRDHNIKQTPALAVLAQKIKALNPILVIPDPMSQLHTLPETSEVGAALIGAMNYLKTETGTAIAIPSHVSKAANAKAKDDDIYALRGTTGVVNGARSVINARVLSKSEVDQVFGAEANAFEIARLTHAKNNYGPKGPTFYLVRGEKGVWEAHDATRLPFRDKDTDAAQWMAKLQEWTRAQQYPYFSMRDVTQNKERITDIFGTSYSRAVLKRCFDESVAAGTIRKAQPSELPESARLGGGTRYKVAANKVSK